MDIVLLAILSYQLSIKSLYGNVSFQRVWGERVEELQNELAAIT